MKDLRQRVLALSKTQREVLVNQLEQISHAQTHNQHKQLAAYVTGDQNLNITDLKNYLKNQLPDYMQPALIKQIDVLPRLPNGKIDFEELRQTSLVELTPKTDVIAAINDTERILIEVWEKVLDFSPIAVDDNFFEIGGDSILSIQIIAQARKLGIIIAPDQIFQHQTISALAQKVNFEQQDKVADPLPLTADPVPITPIQHWFFSTHKVAPHYWNQILTINIPSDITAEMVKESIGLLALRHDALRLCFQKHQSQWQMVLKDLDNLELTSEIQLDPTNINEQEAFIKDQLIAEQKAFKLNHGSAFRAMLFTDSENGTKRLYLIAHHLVVDAFSWRIIIEDLIKTLTALSLGEKPDLPQPTTPFITYGQWVNSLAESPEIQKELEFWNDQVSSSEKFPLDFDNPAVIRESTIDQSSFQLDPQLTDSLVNKIPKSTNLKPEVVLITALALALYDWRKIQGFCLGLEGHGRGEKVSNMDVSRTVGWLTNYYPVRIDVDTSQSLKDSVISVKHQLSVVPGDGLGYGVLRYIRQSPSLNQNPPIVFNYLGNLGSISSGSFDGLSILGHSSRDDGSERDYHLELNVKRTGEVLYCDISYSRDEYQQLTVNELLGCIEKRLIELIDICTNNFQTIYDPKDFPQANLSKGDLDNLLDQL
jgi:non-ribosomal peptide synthase protein (TIGR01720 family)